ncbi:hypothetical protein EDD86DRAFT_192668 [Gorgonomyces haynaldii]|nr:hypothetical protein EDD86DRAFT_192668 [Gorgonomyces haynaldii]
MSKSAAQRIDWGALGTKLKPDTLAQISVFRRRHQELTKLVGELREQNKSIDFAFYESKLQNKKVVSEAKKTFEQFKPAAFDLQQQLKVIQEHEQQAVQLAKQTEQKIQVELKELQELLVNIEQARPVDELTVDDVAKAYPELEETVAKMAKRGQWRVPGYYERFGEFAVGF